MSDENTKEIWKDVVGYEGLYQVSNLGRIKSCDRVVITDKRKTFVKGRILVQNLAGSKYNHIKLCKKGEIKRKYIHRLIAESFIENKENKAEVNHINENTRDNRVVNLEWATRLENIRHSFCGDKNPKAKPKEYYENHSISFNDFKNICKRRNWDFENFIKTFDKYQIRKNGNKIRKYFFKLNEDK